MKKKCLRMLLTAVTAVSLLTGCGSGKGMMNAALTESAYDSAAQVATPAAAPAGGYLYDAGYEDYSYEAEVAEEAPAEAEEGWTQEGVAEEVSDPQAGRKLITTMNISAETEDFDALMGNLERQVATFGGYIESSDQWNGTVDYYGKRINDRNASLTIRIPIEKLSSFLTMVEENSNITNKSKSVEDVTLAYVDLESHKKALLTAEERLLELLEKAENVEDLIAIEEKLTDVRYQLESMESQLRTYDNKINYSTVYLYIQEVTRLTPPEEVTTWGRIKSGFAENLYNAGQDILDFIVGLIVNIPYIVIGLVILAVVLLIVFLLAKREKKKRAKRLQKKEQMQILVNTPVMQKGVKQGEKLPHGIKQEENETEKKEGQEENAPVREIEETNAEKKEETDDTNK